MDPLPCERKGGMGMARDFIAVDECNVMHSHPYITLHYMACMYMACMYMAWMLQGHGRLKESRGENLTQGVQ